MSECNRRRCQLDRKLIRQNFSQWTKKFLVQIGLETLAINHLNCHIKSLNNDEHVPVDFNPDQACLFCLNRKEYLSTVKINPALPHLWIDGGTNEIVYQQNNSPIVQSLFHLNSQFPFDMKSDNPLIYHSEEYPFSHPWNYLFQTCPTLPINIQSPFLDHHIEQLAKQMAYLRMLEEIDHQRQNRFKSQAGYISPMLTDFTHVSHILNEIMLRMINEVFEEQIKQQTNVFREEAELSFMKKQKNQNRDDITIINAPKQHERHIPAKIPPSLSTSSVSSVSSTVIKMKATSKQNHYSTSHRSRELLSNHKVVHSGDGKQVRPKRGQYRRYESQQLSKAVAAVLRNEMSVYKAGCYFSVPHSTLEYKVKEWHAKRTPKPSNQSSPSVTSKPINDETGHVPGRVQC